MGKVFVIRVYAKDEKKLESLFVSHIDATVDNVTFGLTPVWSSALVFQEENVDKMLKMVKADFGSNYSVYKEELK